MEQQQGTGWGGVKGKARSLSSTRVLTDQKTATVGVQEAGGSEVAAHAVPLLLDLPIDKICTVSQNVEPRD